MRRQEAKPGVGGSSVANRKRKAKDDAEVVQGEADDQDVGPATAQRVSEAALKKRKVASSLEATRTKGATKSVARPNGIAHRPSDPISAAPCVASRDVAPIGANRAAGQNQGVGSSVRPRAGTRADGAASTVAAVSAGGDPPDAGAGTAEEKDVEKDVGEGAEEGDEGDNAGDGASVRVVDEDGNDTDGNDTDGGEEGGEDGEDDEESPRPKRKRTPKREGKVVLSAPSSKKTASREKTGAKVKSRRAAAAVVAASLKKKKKATSKKARAKKPVAAGKKPKKPKKPKVKVVKPRSTTRKKRERLVITNRDDFVALLADAIALPHVHIVAHGVSPVSAVPLASTSDAVSSVSGVPDDVLRELEARLAAVSSARRRTQKRKPGGSATTNSAGARSRKMAVDDEAPDGDDDTGDCDADAETADGGNIADVTVRRMADDVDFQTLVATLNLRLAPDKSNGVVWCRHVEELVMRVSETRSDYACRIHAIASHILHTRTAPESTLCTVMLQYDYYAPLVQPALSHPRSDLAPSQTVAPRKLRRGELLSRAEMAHVFRTYTLAHILAWLGLDDATVLYRCPACKKWKGDVDNVHQTRGLDEGHTVHLRCGACKHKWK